MIKFVLGAVLLHHVVKLSNSQGMRSSNGGLSYVGMVHEFKYETKESVNMSKGYPNYIKKCKKDIGNKRRFWKPWKLVKPPGTCPKPKIKCNIQSRFRTIDGTCNNLRFPEFGKSFICQNRFLPPAYDDGIGSPRTKSKTGGPLPSARVVSNIVFTQKRIKFDKRLTLLLMTWGQFTEHDVVFTPSTTMDEDGNLIICCNQTEPLSPDCFPITIPDDDPFFNKTCMEFIRSSPCMEDKCGSCKPREQINQLTSYIDASNVYGSTLEEIKNLRLFKDGLLKTSDGKLLPPREDQTTCTLTGEGDFCFLAGDRRVMEVPTLANLHVTFVRFHNKIARKLKKINPHWKDERIFQETRKIIGAIHQKITYTEYLPEILNSDIRRKFCLSSTCQTYNEFLDPATVNSFGVTAFRFGHTQIPAFTAIFKLLGYKCPHTSRKGCPFSKKPNVVEKERVPLENTFNNPNLVFRDVDGLALFQITNASAKLDIKFDDSIRNKLFLDSDMNSLDLGALDIQRGRDHGIPPYTKFRRLCGLSKVLYFHSGPYGLVDHKPSTIKLLKKAYKHVDDIDLFVGGMTERLLPNSRLGPTFSCIMAKQFKRFKVGDRFWWETRDLIVGFTKAQLKQLRRIRLSKIICDVHNLSVIQPLAMLLPTVERNRPQKCDSLPSMDLRAWKERKSGRYYY